MQENSNDRRKIIFMEKGKANGDFLTSKSKQKAHRKVKGEDTTKENEITDLALEKVNPFTP